MLVFVVNNYSPVEAETEITKNDEIFCYTIDTQENKIYSFKSEYDDEWYLCVPSSVDISQLKLYFSDMVSNISSGVVSENIVSDALHQSGDRIQVTSGEKDYTLTVLQSKLPAVQLELNGADIDTLHLDKTKKFENNTLNLTTADGTQELTVENRVHIKGRGNTSWQLYDKKSYQLTFMEGTSVLGMDKACKWILLANASDDSMMRTALTYRMAENLDIDFVPSMEYVDLWINGEYRGTYLLGEKVEISQSRLNLTDKDSVLMEHDESFYREETHWFYNDVLDRHFTVSDSVTQSVSAIKNLSDSFNSAVSELTEYLYTTPSKHVSLERLSEMIDVDSFAKYYIINEYVLNKESFATSFYWNREGKNGIIKLGPIWDFDTCMGNDSSDYTEQYGEQHVLFRYLLAAPAFREYTLQIYEKYKPYFDNMAADTAVIEKEISESAEMNYLRWNVLGKAAPKLYATDFAPTFEQAVDNVRSWLHERQKYFTVAKTEVVNSSFSPDGRIMHLCFDDGHSYSGVNFAVWHKDSADSPVIWYPAVNDNGVWCADVDLSIYSKAGLYRTDVYAAEHPQVKATGISYAEKVVEADCELSFKSEGTSGVITIKENTHCPDVYIEMWSTENGIDDLQTMYAYRNEKGQWEYKIDMNLFLSSGQFYIKAYREDNGIKTLSDVLVFDYYSDN